MHVGMRVSVLVRMLVFMWMGVIVSMSVLMCADMFRGLGRSIPDQHIHLGGADAAAVHLRDLEPGAETERGRGFLKQRRRYAGIEQGAQQHVAADAGKAV